MKNTENKEDAKASRDKPDFLNGTTAKLGADFSSNSEIKGQKIISVKSLRENICQPKTVYSGKKKKTTLNGSHNQGIFQTSTNQEHLWPAARLLKDIVKEAFQARKDPLKVERPSEETVSK